MGISSNLGSLKAVARKKIVATKIKNNILIINLYHKLINGDVIKANFKQKKKKFVLASTYWRVNGDKKDDNFYFVR